MKFFFDLLPVFLFFLVFKGAENNVDQAQQLVSHYLSSFISGGQVSASQAPIILATAVAIVATIGQILYLLLRKKKIDVMLWLSLVIIVVFGGATIYLHDETFIKWKPTILYWCFAIALFVSATFFKKNLVRAMMEKQMQLPDPVWKKVNLSWVAFFAFMGILNLVVAFTLSTESWVNFKMFGGIGLMLVFIIGQSVLLAKYMKEDTHE